MPVLFYQMGLTFCQHEKHNVVPSNAQSILKSDHLWKALLYHNTLFMSLTFICKTHGYTNSELNFKDKFSHHHSWKKAIARDRHTSFVGFVCLFSGYTMSQCGKTFYLFHFFFRIIMKPIQVSISDFNLLIYQTNERTK